MKFRHYFILWGIGYALFYVAAVLVFAFTLWQAPTWNPAAWEPVGRLLFIFAGAFWAYVVGASE